MKFQGYFRIQSDARIFVFSKSSTIVAIYIDDSILMGSNCTLVHKLKCDFIARWEAHDLREVSEFLDMQIIQDGQNIHLNQHLYLNKILDYLELQNCQTTNTSLPENYKPSDNTENIDSDCCK